MKIAHILSHPQWVFGFTHFNRKDPQQLVENENKISTAMGGLVTIAGELSGEKTPIDYRADRMFAKKTLKLTLEGVVESPHFKLTDAENVANWAQR